VPTERIIALDRIVFEGYLQGLRESGWNGESRLVRLGYVTTSVLRYFLGFARFIVPTLTDQYLQSRLERQLAMPINDVMDRNGQVFSYLNSYLGEIGFI
jgi:hypothetical protein